MKTEVFCPYCKTKRFKLVNEVGNYDVEIHCAQCGAEIGVFNGLSVVEKRGEMYGKSND